MRKLNLTQEIEVFAQQMNPQTGQQTTTATRVPVSKFILQGLDRSQTFAEAKFKTQIIDKINKNPQEVEVDDAEYSAIVQPLMSLTSPQKNQFANMVLELNPDLTIEQV
jgi:hypothetical protein